jgi:hypothetical protein
MQIKATDMEIIMSLENIEECPFSCFCPYYGDKEKEVFSDVVRSIPIMLEDIELNENNN